MRYFDNIEEDPVIGGFVLKCVGKWKEGIQTDDDNFKIKIKEYARLIRFKYVFISICLIIIFLVAAYSITLGSYEIGFFEVYDILWNHIIGNAPADSAKDYIVWELRLPRVIFGIFGGAALAVAGTVMQSILKNPLADSYTTGVSSGAGFGATLAMTTGIALNSMTGVVIYAFLFSLIPTVVIIAISRMSNASPTTMIMAGIGTMYIFSAMTTVMMLWADPNSMAAIYAWQVGSLSNGNITFGNIPIIVLASLAGIIIIGLCSHKINVLATGDESAKALGIDADKLRIFLLLVTGILAASIVSFVGIVGFVGLVSPHIVRMFIGADNRYLIPGSAIFGGMIMIVADQIGRVVSFGPLPVGVIMAFLGGPIFLWLILRKGREVW